MLDDIQCQCIHGNRCSSFVLCSLVNKDVHACCAGWDIGIFQGEGGTAMYFV